MLKHVHRYHRPLLCFFFLLTVVLTGCASLSPQPLQAQAPIEEKRNSGHGVRVIEVIPDGQAERAGIQTMDLLSKYGKFTVVDHSTYYKAREFYLKTPDVKVKVEFWRGHAPRVIEVLPGQLGIDTNEYNPVGYQLDSVMQKVDALQQIPAFQREFEFKEAFENGGIDKSLVDAREIVDRAEGEGTLTATEILVARISMILDNASEEELKKQDVLLADFTRNQPAEYIGYLGQKFLVKGHFRPARELLKQYLLTDPENFYVRLDLGHANLQLGLWDEAEAGADLVLTNPEGLSPEEFVIAYLQKACAALNRGDYNTSITFAEKSFALGRGVFDILLIQLAAAARGDVEKFRDAAKRFKEALPEKFEIYKLQVDSAEALALSMSGQDELARSIVAPWAEKDRVEGRLRSYWRHFPAGNKAVDNWVRLTAK
jgi:tetratricopeptide (TPR) repeat protein